MNKSVPVITVDGPGGVGKGTLCQKLAQHLGWKLLDSGALYRVLAVAAEFHHISLDDVATLEKLAAHLDVYFKSAEKKAGSKILLEGEDVSALARSEQVGDKASKIAMIAEVRQALLARQRAFKESPGLVADGRDMGTVVFPEAKVKIFLTASVEARAQRRFGQLQGSGASVSLAHLLLAIEQRDSRDRTRSVAPLKAAPDAILLDTTDKSIKQVFEHALALLAL